jgi:hypothetical protein
MAAEGQSPDDARAHEKSYSLFVWMMKWGAIVSLIVTLIVILLIRA